MRVKNAPACLGLLLLAAAALASDAARPNFAGVWELDQARSHSIPPDVRQTMTVTQEGDRISVELKVTGAQGERVIKEAYTLDGKETEFDVPPPPNAPAGTPPMKGKRRASWMPNDKGVLIEEEVPRQTPDGLVTITIARKWMMWPDGTMSIEVIQDTPRGTFNSKRVFVKAQPQA